MSAKEIKKTNPPSIRIVKIKPVINKPPKNPSSKVSIPPLPLRNVTPPRINKDVCSFGTKNSTVENSRSHSKDKQSSSSPSRIEEKYISSLYNKYNYLKGKLNKDHLIKITNKSQLLTPIPNVKKKAANKIQGKLMNEAISNAIILRRLEYNEYIKNANNLKPRKGKRKKKVELIRKPSFDEEKVVEIQKVYKGYSTRVVNKSVVRLKVRSCLMETFCLIYSKNFEHALKRLTLSNLKTLYLDPFIGINNEVSFSDKLQVKLANKYYNFVNFKDIKENLNKTVG